MKNEKLLVYEQTANIRVITEIHENTAKRLQQIHDGYRALGFPEISTHELKTLVHHTDTFITSQAEKLIPEIPQFGPFKMKTASVLEQLELPDYSHISNQIKELREYLQKFKTLLGGRAGLLLLDHFELVEGKVQIISEMLQRACDAKRIFAKTEKQIKIFKAQKKLVDSWNALDAVLREHCGGANLAAFRPEVYLRKEPGGAEFNEMFYIDMAGQ